MTRKDAARFALAALLCLWASVPRAAFAAPPAQAPRDKEARMLGEVEIVGTAERPGVLFVLPRPDLRLLPLPAGGAGAKERVLRDTRENAYDATSGRPSSPE